MSEELIAAARERIADLLEPINGGVGEDVSYDEKFEEIKAETEKIASLTGEVCNWGTVATNAEEILQEKSKDFRVACYLAACKARSGSVEGIIDGLLLLQELCAKFWDDMYPPLRRIRARAGMVGWMSDQAGPTAIDYKLTAKDNEAVQALDKLSVALDAEFRDKFADAYPGMSKLRDAVRHLVRTCPKEKPKPEPKPEPPKPVAAAEGAPAAVAAPPPPPAPVEVTVGSPEDAYKAISPALSTLQDVAGKLRGVKPEHELVYRLSRVGIWLDLESAPPTPAENKTLVPPPEPHVRAALDGLAQSSDWLALLNAAEVNASEYILWLDLHRYSSTAMSALGALFMKAKQELLFQVAIMLKRVPTLPKLAFSDGTPFADGATQMWLESEVLPILASGDGGGGGGGGPASVLDEPLKEARDLAVKGELGKALAVVRSATAAAPTPAERFRGQLALAQLCLGAGQHAIARSQYEGLTVQIEQHQLTRWDPSLCAEVYSGLYSAIKGMNDARRPTDAQAAMMVGGDAPAVPPEDEAAERAAFEMLCRLDPAEALKLGGKK